MRDAQTLFLGIWGENYGFLNYFCLKIKIKKIKITFTFIFVVAIAQGTLVTN